MAAVSGTSCLERVARIAFGAVVAPFFAGLSLIIVHGRAAVGEVTPKNAPPDVLLVAVTLFLGLIAAYGLDQLLAGVQPSRRRWFTGAEQVLGESLEQTRGRGGLTIAHA